MALHQQFSIAVHIMTALGYSPGGGVPSRDLAASVNANPSFVRRILSKLAKAGLVHTTTGKSGACGLGKKPGAISLFDIYKAVEPPKAFSIHHYAARKECAVSCHIKSSLTTVLNNAQATMEGTLKNVSLAKVIADIKRA